MAAFVKVSPEQRKVIATLYQARASINTPDKWTQGADKRGGAMCAAFAIERRWPGVDAKDPACLVKCQAPWRAFVRATGGSGDRLALTIWNDVPGRTHREVMQMFSLAILLVRREGNR